MTSLFNLIRYLKVKLVVNTLWRWSPKSYLRSISLFSATESDTVWQLIHAFYMIENPKHRAEIFTQILEEDFHAKQFEDLINITEQADNYKVPFEEKKFLYSKEDPVWKLLAYCYIGEKDAADKFKDIMACSHNPDLKRTLAKIIHDETSHVGQANSILYELGAKPSEIKMELWRIRLIRKYESLVRNTKRILEVIVDALLAIIYFTMGLLVSFKAKSIILDRKNS
jgi:rubrerythrin